MCRKSVGYVCFVSWRNLKNRLENVEDSTSHSMTAGRLQCVHGCVSTHVYICVKLKHDFLGDERHF